MAQTALSRRQLFVLAGAATATAALPFGAALANPVPNFDTGWEAAMHADPNGNQFSVLKRRASINGKTIFAIVDAGLVSLMGPGVLDDEWAMHCEGVIT